MTAVEEAPVTRRGAGLGGLFGSLAATQVIVSALGFLFWTSAARLYSPTQVGLAAAAISALSLVAIFAMLGVGTLLIAELPNRSSEEIPSLFGTGLAVVAVAGLTLGIAAGAIAPHLAESLAATGDSPLALGVFALGVAGTAVGAVFDEAVLGLRRGQIQLLRNGLASVIRLALLFPLFYAGFKAGHDIVFTWTASLLVSLAVGVACLRLGRLGTWRVSMRDRVQDLRTHYPQARGHLVLNLILQSSGYLLPVLGSLVSEPSELAYFNSARLISAALLTIPFMLTVALFAATAADPHALADRMRLTVPLGLVIASACPIAAWIGGGWVMGVFGEAYGANSPKYLVLLLLAGPLLVVKDHYVAVKRVRGELEEAAKWVALATFAEMAVAMAGGLIGGLVGLCVGWLVALALEACVMAPVVLGAMHETLDEQPDEEETRTPVLATDAKSPFGD